MARAVNENGEIIILSKYSRHELRTLERHKYYCLKCKGKLILKVGERKRPHFAHLPSTVIEKGVGESDHHKLATNLLYRNFKNQGFKTKIEHFISKIKQRPDVVVFFENEAYAFEFQAANISLTLFRNRTLNLKKAGFKPIWLLSNHLLNMKANSILRITPFISQFIHRFSINSPPQLFFFNPEKQKVIILEHILLLSEKSAYVQKRTIPLNKLTLEKFNNYSLLNFELLLSLWKNEKYQFRTRVRFRSYGTEYHWRLWLYQQHLNFETLPSIIHLPTRDNYYFKVPPWNWQSRLYLKVIHSLKLNEVFSYHDCLNQVGQYLIPQTHYPLIENHSNPLLNYLKLLTHLQIIKPLSNKNYIKHKNCYFNDNLQKSIIADDDIIKLLLYNLS